MRRTCSCTLTIFFSCRGAKPKSRVSEPSMQSSTQRLTRSYMQDPETKAMEKKQPLLPNALVPQLSVRSARALPGLRTLEEPGNPYYMDTGDRPEESGGLLESWRLLVRHKTAILALSIGGLLVGVLIGIPLKPVFRASTTREVLN